MGLPYRRNLLKLRTALSGVWNELHNFQTVPEPDGIAVNSVYDRFLANLEQRIYLDHALHGYWTRYLGYIDDTAFDSSAGPDGHLAMLVRRLLSHTPPGFSPGRPSLTGHDAAAQHKHERMLATIENIVEGFSGSPPTPSTKLANYLEYTPVPDPPDRFNDFPDLLRIVIMWRLVYRDSVNTSWVSAESHEAFTEQTLQSHLDTLVFSTPAGRRRVRDAILGPQSATGEEDRPVESISELFNREGEILATLTPRLIKKLQGSASQGTRNFRELANILQITDKNHASLPSIFGARSGAQNWLNASTKQLSALTPKIRFFKRNYSWSSEDSTYEFEDDVPIRLEAFFSDRALQQITDKTFGKGGGYGVKSVDIESIGDTLGTEKILQKVNVVLYSQTLQDLLPDDIESFGSAADNSPLQLILAGYNIRATGDEPINNEEDFFQGSIITENFTGRKQDIVLEFGWSAPTNHSDPEVLALAGFLDNLTTKYVLNQIQFTFNFLEDGTFDLNIEFIGRLDFVLNADNLNVLALLNSEDSFINAYEQERRDLINLQLANADLAPGRNTDTLLDRSLVNTAANENILNNYSSFLNELFKDTKLYRLYLKKSLIVDERTTSLETALEALAQHDTEALEGLLLQRYNAEALSNANFEIEVLNPGRDNEISTYFGIDDIEEALRGADSDDARDLFGRTAEEGMPSLYFDHDRYEYYTIPFFRLGDILDTVVKAARNERFYQGLGFDEEPYFISGPIIYSDFITNPDDDHPGKKYILNVCDILISLRQFREFFMDKIVLRTRTQFGFKNFIKQLVEEFCQKNALSAVVETKYLPSTVQTNFSSFEIDYKYQDQYITTDTPIPLVEDLKEAVPGHLPEGLNNILTPQSRTRPALFFQAFDAGIAIPAISDSPSISAQRTLDMNRGIYWFEFGNNFGVLKNVSFSKLQIPGLRDAAIIRAQSGLGFVRSEPYNIDMTIFGSSFMFPAQYIYFNPTSALGISSESFGEATMFGKLIQIGGYYFVTKVTHRYDIGSGLFETNLNCVYQGDGRATPVIYSIAQLSNPGGFDIVVGGDLDLAARPSSGPTGAEGPDDPLPEGWKHQDPAVDGNATPVGSTTGGGALPGMY